MAKSDIKREIKILKNHCQKSQQITAKTFKIEIIRLRKTLYGVHTHLAPFPTTKRADFTLHPDWGTVCTGGEMCGSSIETPTFKVHSGGTRGLLARVSGQLFLLIMGLLNAVLFFFNFY